METNKRRKILHIIKTIRESFGGSISIYTMGNCYQFYEILKSIFPDAEAFYDGNHVWTKIDGRFFDVRGEKVLDGNSLIPVNGKEMIDSLTRNKWTDDRRLEYAKEIAGRKRQEAQEKRFHRIISQIN